MPLPSPFQRLPGRVTFEWPARATARRWRRDGWHPTPEAGWDLNGFVVCVCDAKQSTDSMIWQGYTKTKTVQQWLQMTKTRRKYIHLKAVIFLPSNVQQIDTISVSGHSCMHFIWKFCQTAWHSVNFTNIFHWFFGGFFALWPNGEAGSRAVVLQTTVICLKSWNGSDLFWHTNFRSMRVFDVNHKTVLTLNNMCMI